MAALPRLSRFLAPVLPSSGVRRTFTLLYTPMRTDQAARDIHKEKTEYISDAAQRQRIGQIEYAQQSAEYNDVLQQEADLTAGHGILRTTGLIAVSAQDPDELERAVADIEQAAIQASCETRRLWASRPRRSPPPPSHFVDASDKSQPLSSGRRAVTSI
jgi:hypothetical protein